MLIGSGGYTLGDANKPQRAAGVEGADEPAIWRARSDQIPQGPAGGTRGTSVSLTSLECSRAMRIKKNMEPPRPGGVARQQHTSADCLQSWRCSPSAGLDGRWAGKRAAILKHEPQPRIIVDSHRKPGEIKRDYSCFMPAFIFYFFLSQSSAATWMGHFD